MITHTYTAPFRIHKGIPGRGMIFVLDTPSSPYVKAKEALTGFHIGDIDAPGLSALQRIQLLGQYTTLNTLAWTLSTIRTHASLAEDDPSCTSPLTHKNCGYMSSQALSGMMDIPFLPLGGSSTLSSVPSTTPTPHPWTLIFRLEQWMFTDGSGITGQPRLGAAVVHVPTCTTISIYAGGTNETRTIVRTDLVVIYTALDKFAI